MTYFLLLLLIDTIFWTPLFHSEVLRIPVFTHGQLYVAVSRSTSRGGIRILIENTDGSCGSQTRNVVYREVLDAAYVA